MELLAKMECDGRHRVTCWALGPSQWPTPRYVLGVGSLSCVPEIWHIQSKISPTPGGKLGVIFCCGGGGSCWRWRLTFERRDKEKTKANSERGFWGGNPNPWVALGIPLGGFGGPTGLALGFPLVGTEGPLRWLWGSQWTALGIPLGGFGAPLGCPWGILLVGTVHPLRWLWGPPWVVLGGPTALALGIPMGLLDPIGWHCASSQVALGIPLCGFRWPHLFGFEDPIGWHRASPQVALGVPKDSFGDPLGWFWGAHWFGFEDPIGWHCGSPHVALGVPIDSFGDSPGWFWGVPLGWLWGSHWLALCIPSGGFGGPNRQFWGSP